MKTQINTLRSKVMKAAWTIARKELTTPWSDCLKKAWAWAKKKLNEPTTFALEVSGHVKDTAKATCLVITSFVEGFEYGKKAWFPKSLITWIDSCTIEIPMWFAKKEGWA